jgi:23S rRNA pseudouridine1911/1915/1917 synthase
MADTDITKETFNPDDAHEFRLPVSARSERLDKVVAQLLPQHSRSRLQGWIESGHVLVNTQPAKIRQLVGPGDVIHVWEQASPESTAFVPQDIPIDIVAQSPHWIVVNKPVGLVTHPGAGNWQGTLLNALLFHFPELAHVARAGIVHRLDKDTSGLLVVARTETAQTHLVRQLQARTVHRHYLALVHGRVDHARRVEAAIGRDPRVPVRMTSQNPVAPKPAVTHVMPQRIGRCEAGIVSLVECRLETGRTHQIRVHMSSIGHALLGDTLYGGRPVAGAARQMLHARTLSFVDPGTEESVGFQAPLPADFQQAIARITWDDTTRSEVGTYA